MINYINALELVLLGVALGLSRSKYTPFLLVAFNMWVQFMNAEGGRRVEFALKLYEAESITFGNLGDQVMIVYLQSGVTFAIFGFVALCLKTRLSYLAGLVILIQSALQLVMGIAIYCQAYLDVNIDGITNAHFIINKLFVILYVVIAWICVHWSRKTNGNDKW